MPRRGQRGGREYPIAFTTGDGGKTFAVVAVLGIQGAENLFFSDSAWARGVYVPAYVRRYPFCMAKVTIDKAEQKNRLICVEKEHLGGEGGEAMFDSAGQPSAKWGDIERLLPSTRPTWIAAARCARSWPTTDYSSRSRCRPRSRRKRAAGRCTSPACIE